MSLTKWDHLKWSVHGEIHDRKKAKTIIGFKTPMWRLIAESKELHKAVNDIHQGVTDALDVAAVRGRLWAKIEDR